jgi:hypothetical protein
MAYYPLGRVEAAILVPEERSLPLDEDCRSLAQETRLGTLGLRRRRPRINGKAGFSMVSWSWARSRFG